MSIFNFLKNIKSFSVIFIPDDTSYEARSRKLTLSKSLLLLFVYTIVTTLIGYYVLQFTGIGHIILPGQNELSGKDAEKMEQLNERILFLAKELQSMKSSNERLKYALILGDSTLVDSISRVDTSSRKKLSPAGGNIFGVFLNLLDKFNLKKAGEIIFIRPATGFISNKFDPERGHNGIDIVVKEGTSVFASAGGFVIFADYTIEYGYTILLSHSEGYITVYKHCSALLKKQRDIVTQGELIALSGNSGSKSTGPHLHFEIWKDGVPLNPESILVNY